jgi:hypothetical protein
VADILDTTIDVIETTAGIICTATRGTTDSVNLGSMAYPIVFSPLTASQLRRADRFGVDISPGQIYQMQQEMLGDPNAYFEPQQVRRRLSVGFQPEVGERGGLTMGVPPPPLTMGASSSSSSGPAPILMVPPVQMATTQVPALTRQAEHIVLESPERYMDSLRGLSETGLYKKQKMTKGS